MLEEEELRVLPLEQTEVDQRPDRGLAEVVGVQVTVLANPYLGDDRGQPVVEGDRQEVLGLVAVEADESHHAPLYSKESTVAR